MKLLVFVAFVAGTQALWGPPLFLVPEDTLFVDELAFPSFSPVQNAVQQRWVETDTAMLSDAVFASAEAVPVQFNLFDGAEFTVKTTHVGQQNGFWQWRGDVIEAEVYGRVTITATPDGRLSGHVQVDQRTFTLSAGSRYTLLSETNQLLYPNEAEPLEVPFSPFDVDVVRDAQSKQSTITVLIMEPQPTQAACTSFEPQLPAIEAMYQNHLTAVWTGQYNVGVDARVRCLVRNVTNNFSNELTGIRNSAVVQNMRNNEGADLVTMMIPNGNACGIGYLPSLPVSPGDQNAAFSVCRRDCAIDNWTLVHELGHNAGLNHDRFVTNDNPNQCNYGGFSQSGQVVRSIMSYVDGCGNCARLGTYSDGATIGRPCNPTGETNDVYFQQAAPVIANYR